MRRYLLLIATTLAGLAGFSPAHAWSPVQVQLECPLGGEKFTDSLGGSMPIDRPFALDDADTSGAYNRTQCPNGFPTYRSFTRAEVRKIALLGSDPEWPDAVKRPYWQRAEWVEQKLGTLTLRRREAFARRIVASTYKVEDIEQAYRHALPLYIERARTARPTDTKSRLEQARRLRIIAYYSWVLGEGDPEAWLAKANAVYDPIRPPDVGGGPVPVGGSFELSAGLTRACIGQPVEEFGELCRAISRGVIPDFDEPQIVTLFGKFFLDPSANSPAVDQKTLECEINSRIGFKPHYEKCDGERPVIHEALSKAYPEEAREAIKWARQRAMFRVSGFLRVCEFNRSMSGCEGYEGDQTISRDPELKALKDRQHRENTERTRRFQVALEGACSLRTELGLKCGGNGLNGVGDPPPDLDGDALDTWLKRAARDGEESAIISGVAGCIVSASLGDERRWCEQTTIDAVLAHSGYADRLAKERLKAIKGKASSFGAREATHELGFTFGRIDDIGHHKRRAQFLKTYPEAVQWEREARQDTIRRYTDIH